MTNGRRGPDTESSNSLWTSTERELAAIWSDVLGSQGIDRATEFFQAGGDSLLATKVALRAREAWGVNLNVRHLLEWPVLEDLAAQIDGMRQEAPG